MVTYKMATGSMVPPSGSLNIPTARSNSGATSNISQILETSIRLSATCPAQKSPDVWTEDKLLRLGAVSCIENWWIGVRNRRLFGILKNAICAAEHSLTHDVLRKLCVREAELLKDPTMQAKIKFRFGGSTFPPIVLFKVYISMRGQGIKYINGKKMIRPSTEAAGDARRLMGSRRYYDLMLSDACHHHQLKFTDEMDVTTVKEYMQFSSNLDETPAHLGGKQNTWRRLDLEDLPQRSHLADVMFCLASVQRATGIPSDQLQALSRPPTQAEQAEHIRRISAASGAPSSSSFRGPPQVDRKTTGLPPSRRSRQAQRRVEQMKKHYLSPTPREEEQGGGGPTIPHHQSQEAPLGLVQGDDEDEEKEGEVPDVDELYQWTQGLSFEDFDNSSRATNDKLLDFDSPQLSH